MESQSSLESSLSPTQEGEIDRLIIAFIQLQDERKTINELNRIGVLATRLSSTGAFLGRKNVTLLIGLRASQVPKAIEAIQLSCHQRIEYISTPMEGAPLPIPLSTPISVGGATLCILEVEKYLEI